jgi:hypothetical protein
MELRANDVGPILNGASFYNLSHATSELISQAQISSFKEDIDGPVLLVY